jgi:hypothetical protein
VPAARLPNSSATQSSWSVISFYWLACILVSHMRKWIFPFLSPADFALLDLLTPVVPADGANATNVHPASPSPSFLNREREVGNDEDDDFTHLRDPFAASRPNLARLSSFPDELPPIRLSLQWGNIPETPITAPPASPPEAYKPYPQSLKITTSFQESASSHAASGANNQQPHPPSREATAITVPVGTAVPF